MKFSELEELFQDYDAAKYSPDIMDVHFGCDCGCGGSSYTEESWDAEVDAANESIVKMISFCNLYGIEYDGML
jgi:hypothetical protein